MKPVHRASHIACVLLFGGVAFCQALDDRQLANRLEAYLKPFVETGNFSGAVLVARKGRVLFRHSYGMANYELQVPNSPETRFHIASVSKPLTAAAILQLEEQGRLSLADHVSRFVPTFPNGDRITLDNLLTHTSGIPDINDLSDYDTFARSPHTLQELVDKFANVALEFQPGSGYSYSNSNYNLLALVLEKVTGETYGDYLRKHILDPLGMRDSGHDGEASRLIPGVASGYRPAGISAWEKAPYTDWSTKTGNGSLYSTVDDLYRFDRALNTDAILKLPARQKSFAEGEGNRYGWYVYERLGHHLIAGKGHGAGFAAELDRFPDDDVTIILLCNSHGTASQDPIARALAAIVFGQEPPAPPAMRAATVPQSTLASYAGTYQYGPDWSTPNEKVTLTAEPGYLLLDYGGFRTPLIPLSADAFLERTYFGPVVMSRDAGGKPSLTIRYGEKSFTARQLEAK
jgi:CubicO group peptidase (beta-lactamase class C family)